MDGVVRRRLGIAVLRAGSVALGDEVGQGHITNQGTLRQPAKERGKDGFRFRSAEEVAVYDALKRA